LYIHAGPGKTARAEPVAARFEPGRAKLAGRFPEPEDQLAGMTELVRPRPEPRIRSL
jgi:phage terminase large subunit-like protein